MKRLRDWWFAPAPAERLAALRIAIGVYALGWVIIRYDEIINIATQPSGFQPIGIVRVLETPVSPDLVAVFAIATCVLLGAFILGIAYRVVAPLAALGLLWTLTYRNAWGMPFHTENLMVMHVIAFAFMPAADVWALARRRPSPESGYGWAIKLLVALTVATYMLAGIAKLRIAGFAWLDGELLRNQIAIDNLRKLLLGDSTATLGTTLLHHPTIMTAFSVLTIVLELGSPVALIGGRIARLWALGAWGFHVGVILLMNIWFPYAVLGFAFLPIFEVERPIAWLSRRWRARRQ